MRLFGIADNLVIGQWRRRPQVQSGRAVSFGLQGTAVLFGHSKSSALSAFRRQSAVRALAAAPSALAFRASATRIRDKLRSAARDRVMFANMAMGTPRDNTACRFVMTPNRRHRRCMASRSRKALWNSKRRCHAVCGEDHPTLAGRLPWRRACDANSGNSE